MNNNSINSAFACFGLIIVVIAVVVIGAAIDGFVLSKMWGWFFVPLFNVSQITIAQAIGVSMVASLFTGTNRLARKESQDDLVTSIITNTFILPALILTIGYIVYQFV